MLAAVVGYKAAVQARLIEGTEPRSDVIHAEFDALDEMVDTIPTTVAGMVAVLEVLGTDPYNERGMSVAAWAYNGSENECPADQLLLAMAAVLRQASS
jgi:hypothetical protein